MKKIILLTAILALSFGAFSCGGGGAGSANLPTGENPGIPSVVQLLPSHFVAQTNSNITLHAKVLDGNGAPVSGVAVTFTNLSEPFGVLQSALKTLGLIKSIGVLSATVVNTDANGIATVNLFSSTAGFATIVAQVNIGVSNVRDRKTVTFVSAYSLNLSPTLTLDVSTDGVNFDQPGDFTLFKTTGDDQRLIRATVRDRFGLLAFDASVTFGADVPYKTSSTATTCSDGSTSCNVTFPNGNNATTDSNGQGFVLVQVLPGVLSDIQTVLNITATATLSDESTASNLVSLFLSPVAISSDLSSITAVPTIVATGGTSSVTATVITKIGTPVPDGTSVNFSVAPKDPTKDPSPCGSITPFVQTTGGVTTPAATFTAPLVPGTCTVTAEVGGVPIGSVDILVNTALLVEPGVLTVDGVKGDPAATFTIFGGVPPYNVIANNPVFGKPTITPVQGGATFAINVPSGTKVISVTYTVVDATGAKQTVTLNVVANIVGLTVMPSSQTVTPGNIATFNVLGGLPPYQVVSDTLAYQPAPSTITPAAGSSSGAFTVNVPVNAGAQTVTFTITDATGTSVPATLKIATTTPDFYLLPSEATIPVGGSITFQIVGGVPDPVVGFLIAVDNPSAVDITYDTTVDPRSFTASGLATGTVNITVVDKNGLQVTGKLTIQ